MYFEKFPQTFYTLDNRSSVQVVTNIALRIKLTDELVNNIAVYDEYDIKDGDTPETLAFELYGDTNLHWVILHANEILDPRFDWPLDSYNLSKFVEGKYGSLNGIYEYRNDRNIKTDGGIEMVSNNQFNLFNVGDAIVNNTNNGKGTILTKNDNSNLFVLVTQGGFVANNQINLASNLSISANITSTNALIGEPITFLKYEEEQNEAKRRIKIIKPQFIERIIKEFESKLSQVNG